MKRTFAFLFAGVALCFAVGCGAPGSLDICHTKCSNDKKCGRASDTDFQNCNNNCNGNAGILMQTDLELAKNCTNPDQILKAQADCFGNSDACNQASLSLCGVNSLNLCIKK